MTDTEARLRDLLARFVGVERAERALRGPMSLQTALAQTERVLSGTLGAASARVIVGATTLQRPAFTDVSACLAGLQLRTRLLTCDQLRQLLIRSVLAPSPQAAQR